MSIGNVCGKSHKSYRRRERHGLINEINITPFIDVTLVLLIVFMVSAPFLVNGVLLDLPETSADVLDIETKPLTISVATDDRIAIEEEYYPSEEFIAKLKAIGHATSGGFKQRIVVRGERVISYGQMLSILALIQQAGFNNIALVSIPVQGG
ncbi:MAG: biopolymer transport protein TolR [Candidatus Tokpelaia sp. JSC085]|nr:MAG: biopolymer transport protein TolR [Candidatus Tokpelaia sp. JSC085]